MQRSINYFKRFNVRLGRYAAGKNAIKIILNNIVAYKLNTSVFNGGIKIDSLDLVENIHLIHNGKHIICGFKP